MAIRADGRVTRLYITHGGDAYFKLETKPELQPGAGRGYFTLDKDHAGFQASVSLLHTSLVSDLVIDVRTFADINPAPVPEGATGDVHNARVMYVFMDAPR